MCFLINKYTQAGKGNGDIIFKRVLRECTTTDLYLRFSWKGNVKNKSLQLIHPIFVDFIIKLILEVDNSKTEGDVHSLFESHLRYKLVEHKREMERCRQQKVRKSPCVRNRASQKNQNNHIKENIHIVIL